MFACGQHGLQPRLEAKAEAEAHHQFTSPMPHYLDRRMYDYLSIVHPFFDLLLTEVVQEVYNISEPHT